MASAQNSEKLNSGGIGLLGATTMGVVMLSPAMTLYGNFGPAFLAAGKAAPLAFVIALIATLPTALSYVLLSRDFPSSGSASAWIDSSSQEMGARWVGRWSSWIVFLYYLNNFIIQPITLGVFLNDLLNTLGMQPMFLTYTLGVLACLAWPAWIAYRGIAVSSKGALGFLLFETVIVLGLCFTVGFLAPGRGAHFGLEGFGTSASPQGMSGIFSAMIFGMLAFCGFDVISTLGEEIHMPRKLIPRATFLALASYGVIIIGGVWVLSYAAIPEKLKAVAESGGMPISEIARMYWGRGALLIPITAISAALGIAIATAVGASRVLFSMGRSSLCPERFARLHPKYRVPWNAMHVIFGLGLIASLVTGAAIGPYGAYVWWATTSTFFAMLTYFGVNLSSLVLNRSRIFKSVSGFLAFGFVPVFGMGVDAYIVVQSFFIELWKQNWASGKSVIVFDLICAAVALAVALLKSR